MSGLESLIEQSVQKGVELGSRAFASGGQVQGYSGAPQTFAGGGQVQGFAPGGYVDDPEFQYMFDIYGEDWDSYADYGYTGSEVNDMANAYYVAQAPEPYWGPAVADPDTAFTSPMATTQPVATAPVKYAATAPQTTQDWYDLGLMIEGGGNMQAPTIRKSDFAYYDAQGEPTIQVQMGGGDSGTWYETQANPNYRPAGYYLTPEAQARLGPQWTKEDATSVAWGSNTDIGGNMMGGDSMGTSFSSFFNFAGQDAAPHGLTTNFDGETGYWSGGGDNPTWVPWSPTEASRETADKLFNDFWEQDSISGMVKSADKAGTGVQWVRQGDSFVPVGTTGTVEVNTNNDHTIPALAMGSLALAAYLAPVAAAEGAAVGAGAGTGATSAAEAFALADSVYGAANLGYTAAELAALGGSAGTAAAAEAALTQFGTTAVDLAAQGATFNAATGVWSLPGYTVYGTAIPAVTAGEVAAGVGAAGAASQLPVFESNYPTDVFEEGFTPSEANPVSGPDTPYVPEDPGPYAPGEAPGGPGGPGTPGAGVPSSFPSWEKALEWALKNPGSAASIIGTIGSLIDDPNDSSGGGGGGSSAPSWNGPIPQYTAKQTVTPAPAGYRPGFSPEHVYLRTEFEGRPTSTTNVGVPGLPGGSIAPGAPLPPPGPDIPPLPPTFAQGGLIALAGGGHVMGQGDGMSDSIPATINGQQDAALSHDEFVIPADVVSDLGNGSSDAGAQVLYAMMDRIRQARHGTNKQPPEINPEQFLPA